MSFAGAGGNKVLFTERKRAKGKRGKEKRRVRIGEIEKRLRDR
jgi:hypothetical protein